LKGAVVQTDAVIHPASPVPLWRNRDYVLLWCGQTISVVGTQVTQIAFPLLVLALTGSPAVAGLVAAARTAPYLLFTLPAGALVDRWDRKLTMVLCGLGSALALASVVVAYVLGSLTIWQIVAVSFIEGTFALCYGLAETSALPRVVPRSQLSTAVAQQQMQYSLGSIVGPPLGGALYAASPLLPFAVDAASYAVSGAAVAALRGRLSGERGATGRSLRGEVAEGVGWLWRQPLIRMMALLTGLGNFGGAGVTLLVIVLAQRQGVSAAATGAIFAAAGVGGVLGALVAPHLQRRFSFGRAMLGLYWFAAAIMLLFAVAVSPPLLAAALFGFSLVGPSFNTVQQTYRLKLIPERLQGRVNSAFRLVAQGMESLGLALTGVLLEWAGGANTALILGSILVGVALLATLNRHVRHAPALADGTAT
jgi:MFS family permease